jgi:alkanesulfonate monooxygenase SsuD/methylene tetrahydromethanopterin reductase-like flavin-dependent oxidoreductase (luciferase family)
MTVRFGLWLCSQYLRGDSLQARFNDLVDQVRLARDVGFDSIWTGHHYLLSTYQQLQPFPLLARLAGEAEPMAVGTSLTLVPLHHPVELAEMVATMDVITRGRFIWGVGVGYRTEEFEAFGVPRAERAARFEESLRIVRALWTGEAVNYHGQFYALRDAMISVLPVQQPHPPIWIGASSLAGARRAARLGDAILLNIGSTLDAMREHLSVYRATLAEVDRLWPTVRTLARDIYLSETDEEAWNTGAEILWRRHRSYGDWGMDRDMLDVDRLDRPVAEMARGRFVIGGPESCREQLETYIEALDTNYILLRVQNPGVSQATALRAIQLLGEQVFPSIRRRGDTTAVSPRS